MLAWFKRRRDLWIVWAILGLVLVVGVFQAHKEQYGKDLGAVWSEQLSKEYKDNEVAGDIKYKDKPVVVSGEVVSINKGLLGGIVVTLSGGLMCAFEEAKSAEVAKLKPQALAVLSGTVTGLVLGAVSVSNCSVLRVEAK